MEIDRECGTACETDNQMELGNGAFCVSENPVSVNPPAAEAVKADTTDPDCGFTQEAGDKCSVLIKEGGRLCDKGCTNLVSPYSHLKYLPSLYSYNSAQVQKRSYEGSRGMRLGYEFVWIRSRQETGKRSLLPQRPGCPIVAECLEYCISFLLCVGAQETCEANVVEQ